MPPPTGLGCGDDILTHRAHALRLSISPLRGYVIRNRFNQHCYGKERVLEVRRSDASGRTYGHRYGTWGYILYSDDVTNA